MRPILQEMLEACDKTRPLRVVDLGSCNGFFALKAAYRCTKLTCLDALQAPRGRCGGHRRWIQCFESKKVRLRWDWQRDSWLARHRTADSEDGGGADAPALGPTAEATELLLGTGGGALRDLCFTAGLGLSAYLHIGLFRQAERTFHIQLILHDVLYTVYCILYNIHGMPYTIYHVFDITEELAGEADLRRDVLSLRELLGSFGEKI